MTELANQLRPKTFSSYVGQEGDANYLKSVIKSNSHPTGIVFTGSPGTGKTTLAKIYVKATLCENRLEGEFEPCNKCESCKKIDSENRNHPNITEHRVTEASAFKEIVSDLIDITKAAPVLTTEEVRDDQRRRFIVIDEVQNASRQSIGPFLDSLEFSHDKVTIILISMDLSKMDPVVKDAVESRCIELNLQSLSEKQITDNIINYYPSIAEKVAELISYLSHGNMRKAWSDLEFFLAQYSVEELTDTIVYNQKFGGLTDFLREELIHNLEDGTWEGTKSIINKFCASEMRAVDLFLKDMLDRTLTYDGIKLVSQLSNWYQCIYKAPLAAMFLPFQGRILVKKDTKDAIVKETFKTVKSVQSSTEDINKMKDSLTSQLANITGKSVQVSKKGLEFLTFKTWRQYLDYYAEDN